MLLGMTKKPPATTFQPLGVVLRSVAAKLIAAQRNSQEGHGPIAARRSEPKDSLAKVGEELGPHSPGESERGGPGVAQDRGGARDAYEIGLDVRVARPARQGHSRPRVKALASVHHASALS
jgi:hypothetical protein